MDRTPQVTPPIRHTIPPWKLTDEHPDEKRHWKFSKESTDLGIHSGHRPDQIDESL